MSLDLTVNDKEIGDDAEDMLIREPAFLEVLPVPRRLRGESARRNEW